MVIISCYIYPILFKNSSWPQVFKEITVWWISMVRQIGFPIHLISVAHSCPLVLIENITQMWQEACHIGEYYIIKCYKILIIFTYNFMKMTQYCYSPTAKVSRLLLQHTKHHFTKLLFKQTVICAKFKQQYMVVNFPLVAFLVAFRTQWCTIWLEWVRKKENMILFWYGSMHVLHTINIS